MDTTVFSTFNTDEDNAAALSSVVNLVVGTAVIYLILYFLFWRKS